MIRTFDTHFVRPCKELDGLWNLDTGSMQTKMFVPGCWEGIPGLESYRGTATLTRKVRTCGGNYRVEFKGVSHTARVFWDDTEIGGHYDAFTPFDVIAKDVSAGEHELRVEIDNRFTEASALHVPNDYMTYGGITRGVSLEKVTPVYIRWAHFTPYKKEGTWFAKVALYLRNIANQPISVSAKAECAGTIVDFGTLNVPANEIFRIEQEAAFANVMPYEPDSPNMYGLNCTLEIAATGEKDDLIERVGFREIAVEGKRILLNGKTVKIRGFNRHEDHGLFGCAIPAQAMDADLHQMMDLGANSVRTCHYPNDELFLDLCDEHGILVWEEAHARGLTEARMRNPNFMRQEKTSIEEMILNHYNHPSIYIWAMLNECASETEYGYECYKTCYELIASLDTSRPRTSASNKYAAGWVDPNAAQPKAGMDLTTAYPTVVAFNLYPGWYTNTPDKAQYIKGVFDGVRAENNDIDRPMIVSEIGAGAVYGYRSPKRDKWTEERQCDIIADCLNAIRANDDLTGVYLWQFCDCRVTEEEWCFSRPKTMNNKGLVDEYRRPKMAYETVKAIYHEMKTKYEKVV